MRRGGVKALFSYQNLPPQNLKKRIICHVFQFKKKREQFYSDLCFFLAPCTKEYYLFNAIAA